MSCTSLSLAGLAKDCATSKGGIKAVYIANYDDVASVTLSESGDTKGMITAITMGDTAKFKQYYIRKGTSSFASNLNKDNANGTNYVSTELTLSFLRQDTAKRIEMTALSVNDLAIIVEDANGEFTYLGYEEPVEATAGSGESGTAATDGNKYGITFTDTNSTFPYHVDPSIIADLVE